MNKKQHTVRTETGKNLTQRLVDYVKERDGKSRKQIVNAIRSGFGVGQATAYVYYSMAKAAMGEQRAYVRKA